MGKEDLLRLFGDIQKEEIEQPKPKLRYERRPRRTIVLRFKTDLVNEQGQHWYVFWVQGERPRRRYSTDPEAFCPWDLEASLEIAKTFWVIDKVDDGRQTQWLYGLFHDKALGLID